MLPPLKRMRASWNRHFARTAISWPGSCRRMALSRCGLIASRAPAKWSEPASPYVLIPIAVCFGPLWSIACENPRAAFTRHCSTPLERDAI